MEFDEDLKKIEEKAKAEAKEVSLIAQDTNKTIDTKLNMEVANFIDKDEVVRESIKGTASVLVQKGLKKQEHKVNTEMKQAQKDENKADFELDKDTYLAFGQETAPNEKWKKNFIKYMANFWFVVISVICFFSLAPFYMYVKVVKSQSKLLKFVAGAVGVLLALTCMAGLTYALVMWCIR